MNEEGPKAPVDAGEIAARMVEAARLRGNGRPVSYAVERASAQTWVPPERKGQVLEEPADNAASFSPPGGCVKVAVAREGASLFLRVSDDGPGILEEHRERIFDRFFTFRPGEEKRRHAGLGALIV